MSDLIAYIGGSILFVGAIFSLLASIGVLRLPDLYTRMHAASKAGVVGGGLILLAVAILSQDVAVILRSLIGIVFIVLTTPVSAHLLARSHHLVEYDRQERMVVNEFPRNNDQNSAA